MKRPHLIIVFGLLSGLAFLAAASGWLPAAEAQSFPTKTPTPDGSNPTPTNPPPPPNTPRPTDPPANPTATSTAVPASATPTSTTGPGTPQATVPTVGAGTSTPLPGPCDPTPIFLAGLGGVNVRSGPGTDYEIITGLEADGQAPIIGRYAFDSWWQIRLVDTTIGWVFDATGAVYGFTGDVPLVDAPDLEGGTPTPVAPWNPTPIATCETPTTTPTTSASPTASVTATATEAMTTSEAGSSAADEGSEQSGASEVEEEAASEQADPTTEIAATNTDPDTGSTVSMPIVSGGSEGATGATIEEIVNPPTQGSSTNWLLIGGVGLILAGFGVAILRRFQS